MTFVICYLTAALIASGYYALFLIKLRQIRHGYPAAVAPGVIWLNLVMFGFALLSALGYALVLLLVEL